MSGKCNACQSCNLTIQSRKKDCEREEAGTQYPSGRTWANARCSSGYSSLV